MLCEIFVVVESLGNLNNFYGFFMFLFGILCEMDWMVVEMGMLMFGEFGGVSELG